MTSFVYKLFYETYKNHFEQHKIIKKIAERTYIAFKKSQLHLFGKRYKSKSLPESGVSSFLIFSGTMQNVPNLTFFGPLGFSSSLKSAPNYMSPDVRAYKFSDAKIIGATDFVLQGNQLFFDDSFNPRHHVSTLERFSIGRFSRNGKACVIRRVKSTRMLSQAINLTSGGSGNFAHCLNEVIPKLVLLEKSQELAGVPIIVDDCIPVNLLELINIIKSNEREVILLKKFESVEVDQLYQLSNPTFAPLDVKQSSDQFGNFTIFSDVAVTTVRSRIAKHFFQQKPESNLKLYFRRSRSRVDGFQFNSGRFLVNQEEIERYLIGLGIQIVELEKVSLLEMLDLMQHASIIISPIGAGLANAIFAKPGIKIIALSPVFEKADYTYHARMVASFGQSYSVVAGAQVGASAKTDPNLPYIVDLNHLKAAIGVT